MNQKSTTKTNHKAVDNSSRTIHKTRLEQNRAEQWAKSQDYAIPNTQPNKLENRQDAVAVLGVREVCTNGRSHTSVPNQAIAQGCRYNRLLYSATPTRPPSYTHAHILVSCQTAKKGPPLNSPKHNQRIGNNVRNPKIQRLQRIRRQKILENHDRLHNQHVSASFIPHT